MATQIKKKFIADNAIDGTKILLDASQSIRVSDGQTVVDLVKYDAQTGKVKVLGTNDVAYSSDVLTEKNRAEAAEAALGQRIDSVISNVDPVAVDSLSEVVTAFQAADQNLYDAVIALGNSGGAGLAQEISDRQAADLVLDGKITQETQARLADKAFLETQIADEAGLRQSGDSMLQMNLDQEASTRLAADQVLQGNIDAEAVARQAAIQSEENLRIGADSALQNAIDAEVSSRQLADTALQDSITQTYDVLNGAIGALQAQDLVLDGKITQEVADRDAAILVEKNRAEGAEAALGVRIDNILSNTDATALNSLAEIVTEFQSVDGDLQTAINNLAAQGTADLLAETQARQAADTALDARLDVIEADPKVEYLVSAAATVVNGVAQAVALSGSAPLVLDGVTVVQGQKVLLQGQASGKGVYEYAESAGSYTLTLVTDASFIVGKKIYVVGGTQMGGSTFVLNSISGGNQNWQVAAFRPFTVPLFINPYADNTLDIGTSAKKWRTGYFQSLNARALDMNTNVISNVATGVASGDAVNKGQMDAAIAVEQSAREAADLVHVGRLDDLDALAIDLRSDIDQEVIDRAAADTALDLRLDVLESVVWAKEKFVVTSQMLTDGYLTLSHAPEANSMSAFVDRLAIHEGATEDYVIAGSVMTFLNALVSGGESPLVAGDIIYVKYQYKA